VEQPGLGPPSRPVGGLRWNWQGEPRRTAERPSHHQSQGRRSLLFHAARLDGGAAFGLLALNAKGDLLAERILSQGTDHGRTLINPTGVLPRGSALRRQPRPWPTTTIPAAIPRPAAKTRKLTRRLQAAGKVPRSAPWPDQPDSGPGIATNSSGRRRGGTSGPKVDVN